MGKNIRVNGLRLRELRLEQALTVRALGERSGIAYDTINKLELGRRPAHASTIRKLAEALSVEPRELMKKEGHMNYVSIEVLRAAAITMDLMEQRKAVHPEHPGVPLCNWQAEPSSAPCGRPAEYLAPDASRVSAGDDIEAAPQWYCREHLEQELEAPVREQPLFRRIESNGQDK
jgi:transcriptional regulator with XRE-family HTH domain